MKKLALNKETLTRLTPGRLATVQGAMRPVGESNDCPASNTACISDYPCNTDLSCDPKCAQPCASGMSVSITKPGLGATN